MLEKRFLYPSGTGIVIICQWNVSDQLKQVIYILGKKNQFTRSLALAELFAMKCFQAELFLLNSCIILLLESSFGRHNHEETK